jgi:hypothetical protein
VDRISPIPRLLPSRSRARTRRCWGTYPTARKTAPAAKG